MVYQWVIREHRRGIVNEIVRKAGKVGVCVNMMQTPGGNVSLLKDLTEDQIASMSDIIFGYAEDNLIDILRSGEGSYIGGL